MSEWIDYLYLEERFLEHRHIITYSHTIEEDRFEGGKIFHLIRHLNFEVWLEGVCDGCVFCLGFWVVRGVRRIIVQQEIALNPANTGGCVLYCTACCS